MIQMSNGGGSGGGARQSDYRCILKALLIDWMRGVRKKEDSGTELC